MFENFCLSCRAPAAVGAALRNICGCGKIDEKCGKLVEKYFLSVSFVMFVWLNFVKLLAPFKKL